MNLENIMLSERKVKVKSEVAQWGLTLCNPVTVAHQAPPTMGFSRQEYWNGLPFPSPGDLPNPGTEPRSPVLQTDSLPTELKEAPCYQSSRGEFATTEVDITNVCILMSI